MNIALFLLIIAFINLTLGLFVLLKNFSKKINRLFFIFSLATSIWVLINFILQNQPTSFWIKSSYAFGAIIPPLAIFWAILLCEEKINKLKLFIFLILGFFFFLLPYSREFIIATEITGVHLMGIEGEIKTGPFFPLYVFYLLFTLFFLYYKLFSCYFKAKGEAKNQLSYVLLGGITWGALALVSSCLLPLFGITKFSNLDSVSTVIFLTFTALAITRYHLFHLKVILTEILVGIMGIILAVLPFLMPTKDLKILTTFLFFLFCLFGYLLISYTYKEIRQKEILEKEVKKRTEELERAKNLAETKGRELEKFYRLTVGRELEMAELKKKIKELEEKLGKKF